MSHRIEVVMPQMGESLAEGTLVRWLKQPGEQVARDEPLFEISTDKVDTDVPSPVAGVLKDVLVQEGQTVGVGSPVAVVESAEGAPAAESAPAAAPAAATGGAEEPAGHFRSAHAPQLLSFRRGPRPQAEPRSSRQPAGAPPQSRSYSPAVLGAARQAGLSPDVLTRLPGSGRGGRLTKRDVEAFLRERGAAPTAASGAAADVPAEYLYRPGPDDQRVPMSPVRRAIARHMTWSVQISPHATAFAEADVSQAAALLERSREQFQAETGAPLTYTVLAARAVVQALAAFPVLNASVVGEEIVLKPHVHLGIAVALPDGDELIVPVIRGAEDLSLAGLARAVHDLAVRARTRRLRPEDVQGGTFTLTNPGIFGGTGGTPILNQPQVAILGLGAVVKRPVVVNDAIAIRSMMNLSLTFDHRAADGMVAFRFLERVREALEAPETP
jgi:pyruvate dehydrogenase E2 component (dihydrolipoamide acetyltransferase)